MPDKLVTIATFSYPEQAHLSRAKLESEGIACFVAHEYTGAANWLHPSGMGDVKLQVKESDAEMALQVLQDARQGAAEVGSHHSPNVCPVCASTDIDYERSRWRRIAVWVGEGLAALFLKRKWKCGNCGYEWKAG
ncbi:MAG: DUF2007 domain-containing protein [Chloroflexi bacterium]|nr:DUF2007 domain-containing protein [Chloroflexota bacterium]